jgi:Na+-driven multidrug efflux pump
VAAFHILLTYSMLRTIGVIGAAWATMFTYGLATAITFVVALRIHPMPWTSIFSPEVKSRRAA